MHSPESVQPGGAGDQQADLDHGSGGRVQAGRGRIRPGVGTGVDEGDRIAGPRHQPCGHQHPSRHQRHPGPPLVQASGLDSVTPPCPEQPRQAPRQWEAGPTDPRRRVAAEPGEVQARQSDDDHDDGRTHVVPGQGRDVPSHRRQGDIGGQEPQRLGGDPRAAPHQGLVAAHRPGGRDDQGPHDHHHGRGPHDGGQTAGRRSQVGGAVGPSRCSEEHRHRGQGRHPPPRRFEREQVGAPDLPGGIAVDDRDGEVAQDHDHEGQDPGHVNGGPSFAGPCVAYSTGERADHRPLCTRPIGKRTKDPWAGGRSGCSPGRVNTGFTETRIRGHDGTDLAVRSPATVGWSCWRMRTLTPRPAERRHRRSVPLDGIGRGHGSRHPGRRPVGGLALPAGRVSR